MAERGRTEFMKKTLIVILSTLLVITLYALWLYEKGNGNAGNLNEIVQMVYERVAQAPTHRSNTVKRGKEWTFAILALVVFLRLKWTQILGTIKTVMNDIEPQPPASSEITSYYQLVVPAMIFTLALLLFVFSLRRAKDKRERIIHGLIFVVISLSWIITVLLNEQSAASFIMAYYLNTVYAIMLLSLGIMGKALSEHSFSIMIVYVRCLLSPLQTILSAFSCIPL